MANRRGKVEAVTYFIFLGSKSTVNGDRSREIKIHLLLRRKAMTNLDSVLKSRDITLPTKVRIVENIVFPVVVYRCESWTIKKAEHQKINAFELWCWRWLLRVPWTARSDQSILKNQPWIFIGRTDAEAPILWPPDTKSWLIRQDSGAGKDWRQKEKGATGDLIVGYHHWLNEFEQTLGDSRGRRNLAGMLQSMGSQRVRPNLVTENSNVLLSLFIDLNSAVIMGTSFHLW